jgi:hypothetical protein
VCAGLQLGFGCGCGQEGGDGVLLVAAASHPADQQVLRDAALPMHLPALMEFH